MPRAWVFPGQGSQHPDMGAELFDRFGDLTATADRIIGVPVRELCRDVDGRYLNQTRYVQPAVFVVSALAGHAALADSGAPDVLAGHSLGEYAALHLSGCLDFEAALRLVVRRGELMSAATGGMVAVLGLPLSRVEAVLAEVDGVDLANHNLPDQVVLAGSVEGVRAVIEVVRRGGEGRCVPLAVSIAAHSRFMTDCADAFADVLREVRFAEPRIPVISNVTARPHDVAGLPDLLRRHFTHPVRWWDTLCHLARIGVAEPVEIGPGEVLTKMWRRAEPQLPRPVPVPPRRPAVSRLGSAALRADYDVRHACLAGSLDHGVSSTALLRRLSDAGLLGFHGTNGLALPDVRTALAELRHLPRYGMAWPSGLDEREIADLYLSHGVRHVETTSRSVTPQLVRFRFADGPRQVLVRVGDPVTAIRFLRPPDPVLLRDLDLAAVSSPVATDIAVEQDALAALPAIAALRDEIAPEVRIGACGPGDPAAVAAAFVLGADFVVTTTINQCTPEAATSSAAKDILADLDVADVRPAPVAELFELGGRAPVARKGTLFAARAEQLYRLYLKNDRLEDIPAATRSELERTHFGRPLDQVWSELGRTARDDKHRMALVFAEYCREATSSALNGLTAQRFNYRVPSGPDMGAFNRFLSARSVGNWQIRHVDLIAEELMSAAVERLDRLRPQS